MRMHLHVPTVRSRVLERKLTFLQRVMGDRAGDLSTRVKEAFCNAVSSLCLVKECGDLEEAIWTSFTEDILRGCLWGLGTGRRTSDSPIQFCY